MKANKMAASMRKMFLLRSFLRNVPNRCGCKRYVPLLSYCVESEKSEIKSKVNIGSLIDDIDYESETHELGLDTEEINEEKSFATLFRESRFVQLGDFRDKMVAGRIIDVINEDLYIDFGGKFYCVCTRPAFEAERYVKGQRVKVMLHQFEMSSSFLGNSQHVTLLEADGTLLGLFDPLPKREAANFESKNPNQHSDDAETNTDKPKLKDGLLSRLFDKIEDGPESSLKKINISKDDSNS